MGVKEEIIDGLRGWAAKLDDEKMKQRFADFNKTIRFDFKDDEEFHVLMVFEDDGSGAKCTVREGAVDEPDIVITAATETLLAILKGELSPTRSFMSGKLKAKGNMRDMLKVQMIMKK
ncbi:MAG: hypothetical protein Kow0069_05460 [Promethearchaeota archaeon]